MEIVHRISTSTKSHATVFLFLATTRLQPLLCVSRCKFCAAYLFPNLFPTASSACNVPIRPGVLHFVYLRLTLPRRGQRLRRLEGLQ